MIKNGGVFNYAFQRWLHGLRREVIGAQLTAMLAGAAAPFVRKLFPKSPATANRTVRRLDLLGFKWPKLDNAINWLKGQQILTDDELEEMAAESVHANSHDFEALQASINQQWQRELQDSVKAGESREEWRERVEGFAPGMVDQAETIGRTFTHRAYNDGLKQITDKPVIAELFPYWLYECTADSRSRPEHVAMGGKVAHRDSPMAAKMNELVNEFNCRCTMIPIDREDAAAKGIDDDSGWIEPETAESPEELPTAVDPQRNEPQNVNMERDWKSELQALSGNKAARKQQAIELLRNAPPDVVLEQMDSGVSHAKAAAHEVAKSRSDLSKATTDRAIASERENAKLIENRDAKIDSQIAEIGTLLTAAGCSFDYQSDSRSRYYRRGESMIRVSDHYVPMTDERRGGKSWAGGLGHQIIVPVPSVIAAVAAVLAELAIEAAIA